MRILFAHIINILESKLNCLRKVLLKFNPYPHWFITKLINEPKNDFNKEAVPPTPYIATTEGENNKIRKTMMILPYVGEKGCTLIKSLKRNLQKVLPVNIQTLIVYTGTKLSSQLRNIKDPVPLGKQHDIVYHSICNAQNCNEN